MESKHKLFRDIDVMAHTKDIYDNYGFLDSLDFQIKKY